MRRWLLSALLLSAAFAVVPPSAVATEPNNQSATYEFHLEEPNAAAAPNGDTITLTGMGVFSVHPKGASGGGGFTHNFAAGGSVSGTWTADGLVSFQPYGCGVVFGTPLPENFCGGQILLRVTLSPTGGGSLSGNLWVTCLIGPHVPAGAQEGVRLNTTGLNFNKEAGGTNIFFLE